MDSLFGLNQANFDHFPRFQGMIFLSSRKVNSSQTLMSQAAACYGTFVTTYAEGQNFVPGTLTTY